MKGSDGCFFDLEGVGLRASDKELDRIGACIPCCVRDSLSDCLEVVRCEEHERQSR
jgi:hypothetical protein